MDLSTVYRDPLAGSKPLAAGLPFHFPLTSGSTVEKGSGGTTVVTTTTTRSSTTQQQQPSSGWTEFAPSAKQQAQASPTSAATASSPSPPIIKHVQNNYNIVQNISIKVGGPERDDDADEEAAPAVRAGPPSARGPPPSHSPTPPAHSKPETARPSTTKGPVANASSSAAAHQANRPGTAASGVPKPIPPPNPSVSKSSGVAVGSAPDKATAVSHYAVGKTIGEGTFGKVRAGIHKLTGLPVAIKILEKERIVDLADVERVKREIHILTRVRHPNVIRLFEVIDSPRHIFLIQEYCSAGELFDYIVSQGRVKEDQACRFFHMILNGTDYFHNKNIIHRDLKPENLLLNPSSSAPGAMDIKIVDFGLGNVVKQGRLLSTACGSPCYAAPEMIAGKRYVGPGADCWSLGVILFALLCGYLPFEDANTARLYEKIMGGEYELPEFLSPESKDLIQKLLNTDPRKRYNAEQVRRHPWYCRIKVPTDPLFPPGDAESPVVPGPQASGKKVKRTISGQTVDDETEIDQSVLQNMVLLGYHPQQVQESIASNRHDHFAATYHLLVMKKNMTNKTTASSSTSSSSGATSKPSGAPTKPQPPPVPRIPTSSHGSSTGSQVPSAPVSQSHHPQPPQTAKPVYVAQRPQTQHAGRETQGSAGTTAAVAAANQHQNQAFSSSGAPASARVATSSPPPAPTRGATVAAGTAPVSTAGGSARVQSAGTVRPSAGGAPTAAAYAGVNTARPGTSYQGTKGDGSAGVSQHPQQQAWNDTASTQAQAHAQQVAALGGTLGVSNGVNGGANVNAYMQHYQAQQAALYAANAGAAAQAYYRPPSSSPQSSRGASSQQPQQPSSQQQKPPSSISQPPTSRPGTSSGPQPQSVQVKAPSASQPPYPRAPSGGSGGGGGRGGRAGAKVKSASGGGGGGQVPTVPQQAFFSGNPMESIATPSYSQHPASSPHRGSTNPSQSPRSSTAAPSPHRGNPSVAIGPATGRPMTSRITGSTGGVSHRLYFPPSERAAHDLALSLANAASRPGTSSGTHPHTSSRPGSSHGLHLTGASTSSSTGGSVSRPGTSSSSRRPPSGQRSHPRSNVGGYKTERERARERERERERELELDAGLDELEWTGEGSSTARQPASSPTGASTASSFNTQLSAMSFKPQRAILEELQRVLHSNGLQFTILPPSGSSASGAAANPLSPLGKHGFVPANLAAGGVSAASASLAPISISSLKPLPRGLDGLDGSSSSSQNQVLEVRAGSNRFQFHVAPIAAGSAGMAKALAADFDGDASSSAGHGAGYAVRVKRVLGDAASFRDICAKLLPQLKL